MKYIPLIAAFFIWPFIVPAQKNKIDSLKSLLLRATEDSGRVNIQNELAKRLLQKKAFDSAFIYSENALKLANKIAFKRGILAAYNNKGAIHESRGNHTEALRNYREALKTAVEAGNKNAMGQGYNNIGVVYMRELNHPEALKNYFASLKIRQEILAHIRANTKNADPEFIREKQTDVASTYNNIGNTYKDLGNYSEALRNYLAALKIAEKIGSKYGIALLNNNIGIIYKEQGNYTEALKYYLAAKKIKEELGQTKDGHYANMLSNLGNTYSSQNNYPEALRNFLLALEIREENEDKRGIANAYHSIGNIFSYQGRYTEAVDKLFAALKLREETDDREGIVASYIDIGNVFTRLKKNKVAFDYLNKGLQSALAINHMEWTKNAYLNLAELDSVEAMNCVKIGRWKEAAEYFGQAFSNYRMHIVYRDSLLNEENTKNIVRVQMAYEFEKSEAAAKEEEAKKETLMKMELNQKDQQLNYFIVGFVLMVLFTVFIFRGYHQKQKANKIIIAQKKLVDKKQKDILDSIQYAKKIQQALLPGDKYVERTLSRLKNEQKAGQ